MMQFLAKAGLAALLSAAALAGTIAPAAAQVNIIIGEPDRRPPPPPGYGRPPPPPPGYGYGRPPRGGCDPRMAENIAEDYGLRRTRIVDVSPRRIVVQGWGRRGPDQMIFGNVRGCPLMRR
jgi:hypothetical protein